MRSFVRGSLILGILSCLARATAAPAINEIMYRPGVGYPENSALEFIEIHNPDPNAVEVSGWAITTGVDFVFPAGTVIPPRGFLVIAADPVALKAASPAASGSTVLGPWKAGGRLANNGEKITLARPGATAGTWTSVDEVRYASEGDWATRTRDALGGWSWVTGADGNNRSLERRNPNLASNSGQNWGESAAAGGTPGAANSIRSENLAPVISGVRHTPVVPQSTDPVTISLTLTDESAPTALAATLHWRDATGTNPGAFQSLTCRGDGTGAFAAVLPPMADKTIIEFYVSASDGRLSRTWPAPTSEGQNANCSYQVDNEVPAGPAPVYRLVLTAEENAAFEAYGGATGGDGSFPGPGGQPPGGGGTPPGGGTVPPGGGVFPPGGGTFPPGGGMIPPGGTVPPGGGPPGGGAIPPGGGMGGGFGGLGAGDRRFNVTLIVTRGEDTTIRYRTSMRLRGQSSRSYTIKPLRISLPNDERWDGVSDFNINSRGAPVQLLAHRILRAAGLVAADAAPIEVRRQGIEASVASGSTADHGQLVRIEEINGDYADNHFPLAAAAQVYRKVSLSNWAYSSATPPADPDTTWSGWSKQNNSAANDWSDVMNFTKVWQDTTAPYFGGATEGNVATGTWNGTPFTDADLAKISTVTDLDYLARWLAAMIIMPNAEENLSTGEDDDYAAAFVSDGTHTRMLPLPHDMDTTFGVGENPVAANFRGLYDPTEILEAAGAFRDLEMRILQPLLGTRAQPGNAAFRQKYFTAIRELFGTVFDADTTNNPTPPFYQFVDRQLAWTPESYRSQIKAFMTERQKHLLGQVGAGKISPATPPASTATLAAASSPPLRLNEVLAYNTTLANGAAFPDIIELHNAGGTAIDLSGKSLTDDAAQPRKYVFPAGTSIAAGGYLVVYADNDTSGSGLHTGFALDAEGDQVRLYDASANGGALLDAIAFGFQIANHSISRTGAGAATWALTLPTIGAANGNPVALGDLAGVKLNEWAGRIGFRVEQDFIELYNPAATPVALGGVRLTDDLANRPRRYVVASLSYIPAGGFLHLDTDQLDFGLDADFDLLWLLGENGATIDRVDFVAQPADKSTGRVTDGAATFATFAVPTPGLSNQTALPAGYRALLDQLRISEIMYQPTAAPNAGDYEFIELVNIGTATLDLSGVRFTNGIDYTFPSGTTLAGGAYIVVAKNRSAFTSRHPNAVARLAPNQFTGALDNSGETLALTLPAPWSVHILRFRYESNWYSAASGGGHALTARSPATTAARDYAARTAWHASAAVNGSPGAADANAVTVALAQATSVTSVSGAAKTLAVIATSDSAIRYQWQQLTNGSWSNLAGATSSSYTISSTSSPASYRVIITTNGGVVASETISLTVASRARLTNLSTRAPSLTGANALVPGFVISGSGTKRLLLRNIGPTLTSLGVTGALADPQLTLKRYDPAAASYVDVTANDNWGTAPSSAALTSATAALGAFALTAGSADAALLVDLPPGQYTASAGGASDGTGIALLELYDGDPASSADARLTNISTRGYVGTGGDIMIAGFVIAGEGSKTLLIRAVGPTLSSFGLTGVLPDPELAIFRGEEALLRVDDWSTAAGAASTSTVATQVGAFAQPAGSKDAALVATLPAGAYTVQVSGANSSTGLALVEIYEAP